MVNKRIKNLVALGLAMSLALGLYIPSNATSVKKMLEAYYGVQVEMNGQVLTNGDQPIIINGKTYVPIRMLMESMNDKSINYDYARNRVIVTNKASDVETMYMKQLADRNQKIADLEKQVKDLQAKLAAADAAAKKTDELDLDDLEDELKDDYGDYKDKTLKFALSGTTSKIKLTVTVKKADWDALSKSDQLKLLNNVCDDIWDEASKAAVEGTIKDGSKTLASFSVKAGKDVSLSSDDPSDLADDLKSDYADDWDDVGISSIAITVTGDDEDIDYKVSFDGSKYGAKWNALTDAKVKSLMDKIHDAIKDEFDDAEINGTAYDTAGKTTVVKYNGSSISSRKDIE